MPNVHELHPQRCQPADGRKTGRRQFAAIPVGLGLSPTEHQRFLTARWLPTAYSFSSLVLATRKPTFSEESGSMKSRNQT